MPESRRRRRATTPEGRMNTLIDLAVEVAEEQLRDRKASPATINQLLKYATAKNQLENTKLEREVALLNAKTEALESEERYETLVKEAINAMRTYQGQEGGPDENV